MNSRITKLRELLKAKSHHEFRLESLEASILNGETRKTPFIIRKAMAFSKALNEMPIFIQDGELIIGARTLYELPEYILESEIKNGNKNIEVQGYDDVFDIHYNLGQDKRGFGISNGDPPNYTNLVKLGLAGIIKLAQEKLLTASDDQKDFYEAVIISYNGLKQLIKRYSDLAKEMLLTVESLQQKRDLNLIANTCTNIQEKSPGNFIEALQLIYFVHICCWIEGSFLVPLGRFDQYLYPFYKNDVIEQNTSTLEDIKEIIECFFVKLNYEVDKTHGGDGKFESDTGQTIVIGGITPAARDDSTNELTYLIIDCCSDLKLTDPKIHIRFHKNCPKNLWDKAIEFASLGMGFPSFNNDESIIEALLKTGNNYYNIEDAYDYAISGCWEVIIPGKTSFRQCCNFDLLQPLEWTLNSGYDFENHNRKALGPFDCGFRWGLFVGKLDEFREFSDLMNAYKKQIRYAVMINAYNIIKGKMSPQPFLSALIDDCLSNGHDMNMGGARYNETDMQCCSLANAADSLYAIKKFVFDDKVYSLKDFVEIVKNNFVGYEELRTEILCRSNHFGNDCDDVDKIAAEVAEVFADEYNRYTNDLNGPFRSRISGATSSVYFSTIVGASADGRKKGDFLASNASPQSGMAKEGPTAVVNSLTHLDLSKFPGGAMLNLKFTPKILNDDKGVNCLKDLIKTYFEQGGLQVQMNIIDSDLLRKAKECPDGYEDLIVRVWGFSTYFVSLPDAFQEQIINETEYGV